MQSNQANQSQSNQTNQKEYEAFKKLVEESVANRVNGRVAIQTIIKNNSMKLDGLTILAENTNISPTIYLNYYFDEYLKHGLNAVVDKIIEVYEQNKPKENIDISFFTDAEKVKGKIKMKLISYSRNKELLKKVPHVRYLDMAIIFYAEMENKPNEGLATIQIYNHHLSFWDFTTETLYELANENMLGDFRLESIFESIIDIFDEEQKEMLMAAKDMFKMQILTNKAKMYGAIGMLQTCILQEYMKRYNTEKLIIIPSSVHEVLLIPYEQGVDLEEMKAMVKEVNLTQLLPEEVLSDNVYIYDGSTIEMVA